MENSWRISGESSSVDDTTTSTWLKEKLPKIIEGYELKNIYNADEFGLFYNLLPDRTFSQKKGNCKGLKQSKDRITSLVCSNGDGNDKLKILVIRKQQNPR